MDISRALALPPHAGALAPAARRVQPPAGPQTPADAARAPAVRPGAPPVERALDGEYLQARRESAATTRDFLGGRELPGRRVPGAGVPASDPAAAGGAGRTALYLAHSAEALLGGPRQGATIDQLV